MTYEIGIGAEKFEDINSEKSKVEWVIMNTVLNGLGYDNYRATDDPSIPPYNYYEEALEWAAGKDYFPNMSDEERLVILRKYDTWNEFEKVYNKPIKSIK